MRHMTGTVYAIMPGRVNFDRGTQMAGIIKDEARHDPSRGFVGGYEVETLPGFGLAGVATNTVPGAWGRDYAKVIEMYDHFAGMWLVGEDLPQAGNGVSLHPTEKDQHGMPVPVVHFKDHANDMAMRNHAYKAGTAVYQLLGAQQVFELPPFPSTHKVDIALERGPKSRDYDVGRVAAKHHATRSAASARLAERGSRIWRPVKGSSGGAGRVIHST